MPWGLELDATDIPGLVAAVGFLLFAVWVFVLDPGSRLHRSFAVLMALRAGFIFFIRIGETFGSVPSRMADYFEIAIPFAALYFGFAYRDRIRGTKRPSGLTSSQVFPVILGLALVVEVAYLRDHSLVRTGPFAALFGLTYLAFGVFAWILARAATAPREGTITRRFALLGSFALAIETAYQATWQVSEALTEILAGYSGRGQYLLWFVQVGQAGYVLAALLSLGAAALVLFRASFWSRARRWVFAGPIFGLSLVAVPLAAMFAMQLVRSDPAGAERWVGVHRVVGGLAMLAGLLVVAYAVLRQRLLNIQWKLRIAVRGTTLAGIFLAAVFVISETLQIVFQRQATQSGFSEGVGALIGVVGASVVVFALHPVQRLAERLSTQTVPNAKPIDAMSHPERASLYREQAELAWLDGELRRKERLLLDGLRTRLGLSIAEAATIETKALHQSMGMGRPGPAAVAMTGSARPRRPRSTR